LIVTPAKAGVYLTAAQAGQEWQILASARNVRFGAQMGPCFRACEEIGSTLE
jgi:hypothetical protein